MNLRRLLTVAPLALFGAHLGFAGEDLLPGIEPASPVGTQAAAPAPLPAQAPNAAAPEADSAGVLRLGNGGFVAGEPLESRDPKLLRWKSPAFSAPLEFDASAVETIDRPLPKVIPSPVGEFRFELAGGDQLFGTLVGLDDKNAELDITGLGRLSVDRAHLRRIARRSGRDDVVFAGPRGLDAWKQTATDPPWRDDAGQIVTDVPGAELRGEIGLPDRAAVEIELSWKTKADFVIALGSDEDSKNLAKAFRFEVWDGDLVVERENNEKADLALLRPLGANNGAGRMHLIAYLDQTRGRLLVTSTDGRTLADLTVPPSVTPPAPVAQDRRRAVRFAQNVEAKSPPAMAPTKSPIGSLITLRNVSGDMRLERLIVTRWDGTTPSEARADSSRIHRTDGSVAYGSVVRFDPESRTFLLRGESGEVRVPVSAISDVYLPGAGEDGPRDLRIVYADGTRISGKRRTTGPQGVELTIPGIAEPVKVPTAPVRSIAVLDRAQIDPPKVGRRGVLQGSGLLLPGRIVDGNATPDAAPVAWQADGARSAVPVVYGFSGKVDYRDRRTPTPTAPAASTNEALGGRRLRLAVDRLAAQIPAPPVRGPVRLALHLRSGDIIPCRVVGIDEQGVSIEAPNLAATKVPHAKIKAIELAGLDANPIKLTKAKLDRLLTVPRMQRDSPPTQLIRSVNGDFLRGRIVSMDANRLEVEVRLETKTIPRDRVARIVWFHADETDPSKKPAQPVGPAAAPQGLRVQAVRADGVRLTFRAESVRDGVVSGESDVVGKCSASVTEILELLMGGAIEAASTEMAYGRWILQNAPDPKFVNADGSGSGSGPDGTESAMVGKPAPDFKLPLLDGKPFQLSALKGQVVVLDFWATWCGPCMQTMPQVERVTKEFADRGVRLVAVNLQEAPKDIKAVLTRQHLDVTVALDRDGVVAEKYNATAITQTVVIDREGNVARLYIGGGNDFDQRLREALMKLPGLEPSK